MHETQEWKDALKANSWADAFQTSDQFGEFLKRAGQAGRRHAERAGAGMSQAVSAHRRGRRAARAELGVALLLGVVGVVVLVDALRPGRPLLRTRTRSAPRPFPLVVAVLLLVCAVALALDVLRGGRGVPRRVRTST